MTPVRAAIFTAGSIKIADLMGGSASFKANGETLITIDEVIKTTGVVTSEFSFDTAIPTTGMKGVDLIALHLNQVSLPMTFSANGKNYTVEGKFDEVTIDTKVASGATTGKFKFSGGKPVAV